MMATLEKLKKYDIIVITEWLQDPNYVKGLEAMFGGSKAASGILNTKEEIFCSEESQYWNMRLPMGKIKDATLEMLRQRNKYDTQLYKEITSCGLNGVVFPADS
jgi:hypothetical protein